MTIHDFFNSRFGVALGEPSTWQGIIQILGAFGLAISPDMAIQIVTVMVALVGLIKVAFKDDPKSKTITFTKTEQPKSIDDVIKDTRE